VLDNRNKKKQDKTDKEVEMLEETKSKAIAVYDTLRRGKISVQQGGTINSSIF